jgi:uncharacterized protein (TIGR00730 family)
MSASGERPPRTGARIPAPPHPRQRRQPLPWQRPKPAEEDPAAWARVQTILESPSYREADQDPEFLERDDTRGLRLHVDYLKPELLLREHHVAHTIVVFGSTRIPEPRMADRLLQLARLMLAERPDDPALQQRVTTTERLVEKSAYYEVARALGRLIADSCPPRAEGRIVVMTGGGPGMMEAANRGAWDAGAKTIGLNIDLPHEQYPNPYITPELCFRFHYFAMRKLHFLLRARALVAFPGGYGTFDEVFETLTLVQTRKITPLPVVLVGEAFWRRAIDFDFLVDEGVIDPEDRELFWFAETAEEIWDGILRWHEAAGQPLLGPL